MRIIDISGIWQFQLDEEKRGLELGYEKGGFDDIIGLPGTTSLARKGQKNEKCETGFLTDAYAFEGWAWFSKTIFLDEDDLGQPVKLFLERTRITRVFVDGVEVLPDEPYGADSLCTPHVYDLTKCIESEKFELTIMVSNTGYPTRGGHMTSPDTQSNWNGITGAILLKIYDEEILKSVRTDTDIKTGTVNVSMEWLNTADIMGSISLEFLFNRIYLKDGQKVTESFEPSRDGCALPKQTRAVTVAAGESVHDVSLDMGDDYELWSEYSPVLYSIDVMGADGTFYGSAFFGMRSIETDEHNIYVNGKRTFLRGKHDGMIFPLTGAAPTDLDSWLRVMSISRSYGINHYRYHTCCPPEAAFEAADLLGIYMEPELPFWGTIAAPGEEGFDAAEQDYLIKEGFSILREFGNHPSFAAFSMGNELWGSPDRLNQIIAGFKEKDRRHLYVQGSNNFQFMPCIVPEDDLYVGVRFANGKLIRGSFAMCDAPLGFVQSEKPGTMTRYDDVFEECLEEEDDVHGTAGQEIEIQYETGVKKVKSADSGKFMPLRPVISHEIGQYCVFPNFREISKYTGALLPRNLETFCKTMEEAGLLSYADDYFWASGQLAVQCYKLELEAAHRSRYLAGYQILDIQDYSGQGTALVGILDAFMDSKGLVGADEWKRFCSDKVVMASFEDFVLESGTTFNADVCLSCYDPSFIGRNCDLSVTYKIYEMGKVSIDYSDVGEILIASGKLSAYISEAGVTDFGSLSLPVHEVSVPETWRLVLELEAGEVSNEYILYVMPPRQKAVKSDAPYVLAASAAEAVCAVKSGKDVVLFYRTEREHIQGFYCTDFWNFPMFSKISDSMKKPRPVGTMGLLIEDSHPALGLFPSCRYATPQWYEIVTDAHLTILDGVPEVHPIVRMMDNFERSHSLGFLWEVRVQKSRVLVCAQDLETLNGTPEGAQFARSVLCYAAADEFLPKAEITLDELENIL